MVACALYRPFDLSQQTPVSVDQRDGAIRGVYIRWCITPASAAAEQVLQVLPVQEVQGTGVPLRGVLGVPSRRVADDGKLPRPRTARTLLPLDVELIMRLAVTPLRHLAAASESAGCAAGCRGFNQTSQSKPSCCIICCIMLRGGSAYRGMRAQYGLVE